MKPTVGGLNPWPQRNTRKLPQMAEGQTVRKERMEKPQTNVQLFGCSWVVVTLISVRSSFSKLNKGKKRRIFLKIVA